MTPGPRPGAGVPDGGVDIEQIDPRNQAALRAWWEVGNAANAHRPGKPWPLWEQSRVALPTPHPERGVTVVGAIDGREMVGAGLLVRPLKDNLHTATAFAHVRPDRTREGIGRRLVEELEVVAVGDGRTTIRSEVHRPPGRSGTGPELFARAMGYDVASRTSVKELTLADYVARRDAVAASAPRPEGYRVVTFDTVCPEEHLESLGRLLGMLVSRSGWTPERIREAEQRQVSVGRHVLTAMAIAPDGSVVGASDVRVDDSDPARGQIGVTIVDPAHRGRRLGLVLTSVTHDLAVAVRPGLVSLDTSTAEVSSPMDAVTEALGYRTIETLLELQKQR